MNSKASHAIEVDLENILPILAKEIYNTPFAFLRENVQNAVDAIRIQAFRDGISPAQGGHSVRIVVTENVVSIRDTGTGMSRGDLEGHYWVIGKSGKHTDEARQAGVVGTFGIGGMANFGVCSEVRITSRIDRSSRAIKCEAKLKDLSTNKECVFYSDGTKDFPRGTEIQATLISSIEPDDARRYLQRIVQYLEIPIFINDVEIQRHYFGLVDDERSVLREYTSKTTSVATRVAATASGTATVGIETLTIAGKVIKGARGFLKLGTGGITVYQFGFLLAQVPVASSFGLEGDIDCSAFRPTAGRETIGAESQQMLQNIVHAMEEALASVIASDSQLPDKFGSFFTYVSTNSRWGLAENATIRVYGQTERVPLNTLKQASASTQVFFVKDSTDKAILEAVRSQGKKIAILSTESRRQHVEQQFLKRFCAATLLEDRIECRQIYDEATLAPDVREFLQRIANTLRESFFIESVEVKGGELTHDALVWVPTKVSLSTTIVVNVDQPQVQRLLNSQSSSAYSGLVDVFVRDSVFPHLEAAFPDLRSRDFDKLLQRIQTTFEQYQIDPNDVNRLQLLAKATNFSPAVIARVVNTQGRGAPKPTTLRRNDVVKATKVFTSPHDSQKRGASSELPNFVSHQQLLERLIVTDVVGKVIDADSEPPFPGIAGHYFALTPESHVLYRHIFERKPMLDFLWGGHRAAFVIYDSGNTILYYDIEMRKLIEPAAPIGDNVRAGSLRIEREPLLARNMVFLPIPSEFIAYFVPEDFPLSFTIRHKVLGGSSELQDAGSKSVVASGGEVADAKS